MQDVHVFVWWKLCWGVFNDFPPDLSTFHYYDESEWLFVRMSGRQTLSFLVLLLFLLLSILPPSTEEQHKSSQQVSITANEERKFLGEKALKDVEKKADDSPCWREAVSRLNSTCKLLSDVQQSRLAVAFANCHLEKSGRKTYPCTDALTIKDCTKDMDHDAFQTYTHFFTHTGHICYFLQNELWQERTEGVIGRLSDASSETVEKLEEALEYHRVMDAKQTASLNNQEVILEQDRRIASSLEDTKESMDRAFSDMTEMAEKQKVLLMEMFGTLQSSVETVRYLLSLLLVEFFGYETLVAFVIAWLVIIFIPRFGYSRVVLHLVLFADLAIEIAIRRIFNYFFLTNAGKPPDDLVGSLTVHIY